MVKREVGLACLQGGLEQEIHAARRQLHRSQVFSFAMLGVLRRAYMPAGAFNSTAGGHLTQGELLKRVTIVPASTPDCSA